MSKAQFQLACDGRPLRAGTMDVNELAPALLATSDLPREAKLAIERREGRCLNPGPLRFQNWVFWNRLNRRSKLDRACEESFVPEYHDCWVLQKAIFSVCGWKPRKRWLMRCLKLI